MFDARLKNRLDPYLARLGSGLVRCGVSANALSLFGLVCGLAAMAAIALHAPLFSLGLIGISRLADGLDGAVARASGGGTDFGGYIDIVFDFAFYGLIPLGFALADPANNALAAAVLLFGFYANGASFLAFGILAAKRKLEGETHGKKSIYFTTGLAEAAETYAVFALFCLFPSAFALIAYLFSAVCLYTALARVHLARTMFS